MDYFDKEIKSIDLLGMPDTLIEMKKNLKKQERTK